MLIRYSSPVLRIWPAALLFGAALGAAQPRPLGTDPRTLSSDGKPPAADDPRAPARTAAVPPGASNIPDAKESRIPAPAWTADARWYYVVIPRFCNGDPENDPAGVVPWSADWPTATKDAAEEAGGKANLGLEIDERRYGGDLQGLINRLPYLKELGVNALCLSPAFHGAGELHLGQVDLRHVDPWIGVKSSLNEASDEKSDPGTWRWTSSDKLLLELIRRAHEQKMRVVVGGFFKAVMSASAQLAEFEAYYMAASKRWMDPDGDGNPADGVDGWLLSLEEGPLKPFDAKELAFWDRWRESVRRLNAEAVVIGSGPLASGRITRGPFDIAIDEPLTSAIQYFFNPTNKSATAKELFDAVDSARLPGPPGRSAGDLIMVSGAGHAPRLLSAVTAGDRPAGRGRFAFPDYMPDEEARARGKLATVFQHFCIGAPVTYYGDEVGMYGGSGGFANAPMWWKDASDPVARPAQYRDDFLALVQWLHHMRDWYAPLRSGEFRRVFVDDRNKTFAFARTLPGDEIILVMNWGGQKQKVELTAGKPGQLVAVFSPQVQPAERAALPKRKAGGKAADAKSEKVEALGVGGSRQFVSAKGKVRLWVAPMSVRVVFVNDKEPRP